MGNSAQGKCVARREALDAPMTHKTKRGLKGSEDGCPSGTVLRVLQGRCIPLKGRREALDAPMTHKTKRGNCMHNCMDNCLKSKSGGKGFFPIPDVRRKALMECKEDCNC